MLELDQVVRGLHSLECLFVRLTIPLQSHGESTKILIDLRFLLWRQLRQWLGLKGVDLGCAE
ncbi:MAG: hypothetical protein AB7X49_10970, partial [Geminicoccaceae bacterium]